jgi:hypothetical protein
MEAERKTHHKLSIDLFSVAPNNVQTVVDLLLPDIAEPPFVGLRFLMARYERADTACARARAIEHAVHCSEIEIEEVHA